MSTSVLRVGTGLNLDKKKNVTSFLTGDNCMSLVDTEGNLLASGGVRCMNPSAETKEYVKHGAWTRYNQAPKAKPGETPVKPTVADARWYTSGKNDTHVFMTTEEKESDKKYQMKLRAANEKHTRKCANWRLRKLAKLAEVEE